MKKRNFKFYLTMLTLVFGAFLISACSGKGTLTFNQAELVMGTGEELELKDLVTLKDTKIENITFESSDSNIVVISPRQTIIAGDTEGVAIITAKGFSGCIEITVQGAKEKFSAPTNIHYNSESSCIEWDNVYSGNVVANNFRVTIAKGDGEPQSFVVNKNYYELEDYGDFKVTIACLSRSGIKESDESAEYSFTKLSAPTGVQYDANTKTLSWTGGADSQAYYIKKDGVLSEKLIYSTYNLDLTDEKVYKISIVSATLENSGNVFGSESEELELTRLTKPQIEVKQGVLSWKDTQTGVTSYKVEVYNSQGLVSSDNIPYNGVDYTFKLSGVPSGAYNVKVQAIGDNSDGGIYNKNTHYLNSSVSESGDITKLETPTLAFNKEQRKISVLDFNNTKNHNYIVNVNFNGEFLEELDISALGETVYDFDSAGEYTFTVVNKATNNKQINSEVSAQISVIKLTELDTVSQSVDASGNYVLSNLSLTNANRFVVEKKYNNVTTTLTLNNGTYGVANEIFNSEGVYEIIITASGDDTASHYIIDSKTTLTVERLKKAELVDDGSKIVWDKVSSTSEVIYTYEINDDETLKGSTTNTYFDYNNLPAGIYTMKVYSKNATTGNKNTLVLDAFDYATINFEITKQIASPVLSITRNGNGYNLNIVPVQSANKYLIKVNSSTFKTVDYNNEELISISIDDIFANKGNGANGLLYSIDVVASNTLNDHYLDSESSVVNVEKITAPTTFTVSETEVVSTTKPQKYITDFETIINGQKNNTLKENKTSFEVKIRYISDVEKYENTYYLDSDYATFTLERMPTTLSLSGLVASWEMEETSQTYVAKLNFAQNGNIIYSVPVNAISSFDLGGIDLNALGLNLALGFSGRVSCTFGKIDGQIAGEYQNGKFISGKDGNLTKYYISNNSNAITLKYADTALALNVTENDKINISWTAKSDCTYALFDGTTTHENITSAQINLSKDNFALAKQYILTLTEKSSAEEVVYLFNLNRLQPITKLNVNKDETITVDEQEGALNAVITKGGMVFDNLNEVATTTELVKAKYVAKTNINPYTFYLDSEEKTYSFVRLDKLNTTTNLNLFNNIIRWTKEDVTEYSYKVKFSDDAGTEPTIITLNANETNSIDLTKQEYQEILNNLSGKKYITIQKYVGEFTANALTTNYLSSTFCDNVLLKIIETPTNVKVEATNVLEQNELKITWTQNTEGVEISKYIITITHNGQTYDIESDGILIIDSASEYFKDAGEWFVKVKALGLNDSIVSNYSEEIKVTRLATSNSLMLGKTGEITWARVENVKEYQLVYKYVNKAGETKTNSVTIDNTQNNSNVFVECLNDTFDGNIELTLYALGDGTTTLTSIKQNTFVRLPAPVVMVQNDRIVIDNYNDYPQDSQVYVVAKIDGQTVINSNVNIEKDEANKYVWYLPTEYKYIDENGQTVLIDTTTQKVVELSLFVKNQDNLYLDSNITSLNVTTLSALNNLRFIRDDDGVIHFKADNANENVTGVKLKIGETSKTFTGNIDLTLDEETLKLFGNTWTITVQAVGELKDSVYYVNSKVATISGTKLMAVDVDNITTKDGAVVWQEIVGSTDYKLCIDESVYKDGYKQNRKEALKDKSFASGEHILTIKAIGNIANEDVTTNIVLDSDYSSSYTVTKLPELSDLAVKNGYFTFTEIQKASEYAIEVYESLDGDMVAEYSMEKVTDFPAKESFTYYHNTLLLEKLKTSKTLYIKIYNKTTEDNYVYSNYALTEYDGEYEDYIKVARLENADETVTLYNPTKPDGSNLDYLTTIAKWANNPNANSGYVISLDNELQVLENNFFTLDEDSEWSAGSHTVTYKQLGSQGMTIGRLAYLTAEFATEVKVIKLAPVTINLARLATGTKELCLTYETVAGADKFYTFLEDKYYKEFSNSTTNIALKMDELEAGRTYTSFGMRAVNTLNVNYLASTMNYVTFLDEEEGKDPVLRKVQIAKIAQPKQPTFNNGAFYWELSTSQWQSLLIAYLQGQDSMIYDPLEVMLSNVSKQRFVVNFISKATPVMTYSYMDTIDKFIYMSDSQKNELISKINTFGGFAGLSEEQKAYAIQQLNNLQEGLKGGFASTRFGFNKFASDLPTGEYEIKLSMIGQDVYKYTSSDDVRIVAKFSSEFISLGTKYVAPAPNVTAVAKDGKYTLEFNNVNVNTNYFTSAPSYNLIGVYYDKTLEKNIEKVITTVSASGLNNSEKLEFNLSKLIDDKLLDSTFTQIYVTLKGDNSNVLNGKPSNMVNINILDEIEAKVEHGVINWHAQQYAADYQVAYNETGSAVKAYKIFEINNQLEWYNWDSAEMTESKAYNVTIQARGLINGRINNTEIFRMSGKVTSIGTVTKLPNISNIKNGVDIVNGLFTWDAVENATAYDVYYTRTEGKNYEIALSNNTYFETLVKDSELYYYYFMAIGTEEETLNDDSNIYVNSKLSEYNMASRVRAIENITFNDGIIKFTPNQGYRTNYYKLTFYKLDSNGERSDKLEVFTTETTYDTNQNASLLAYGRYDVDIQACYPTKDKAVHPSNPNEYLLISYASKNEKVASTSYYKFDAVTDLQVKQGRISWTFNNDGQISANDYAFKLEFSTPNQGTVVKYVSSANTYFEDVVYDEILTSDNITLTLYVCASTNTQENYVKSVPATYLNIHQYEKIDESKIEISTTEDSQLKVDWSKGVKGTQTEGFKYEISFMANGQEEKFYTQEPLFVTGEGNDISFDIDGDYTIVLRIRVIPMVDNYISSTWTDNREIARPKSVSGLKYDEESCTFTWDKYEKADNWSSYKYKIKDEVTYINSVGDTVTEVYIFTAETDDTTFTPFATGTHKVSVAVMVSNSSSDSFISEYSSLNAVEFNLFAGGNGTEQNPYLISNVEHFNNIKFRMTKDPKNNTYYFGTVVDGVTTLEKEITTETTTQYCFKQTASIVITKNGDIDQTLNTVETEFDGVYNGNYYSLTLDYTHIAQTTDFASVSIFNTISKNATVKNLKLFFSIVSNDTNGTFYGNGGAVANINLLCQENNGTVTNIVIGDKSQTIRLTTRDLVVVMSFIANNNNGIISNVQNNYNVQIEDTYRNNQRNIQFASLVINNYNRVEYVKNNGLIDVTGSNIIIGGLIAYNTKGAKITAGANAGNITIYYNKAETSYVGGLVAKNDNGELSYCYATGKFDISASGTSVAKVGGLVGWSVNDKISYSYVNVTMTTTITNFNMYQVIGQLDSSQNQANNVYYKKSSTLAGVNGSASSGFKTYTNLPTEDGVGLYSGDSLFNKSDVDSNKNPRLNYEATFENITWKD